MKIMYLNGALTGQTMELSPAGVTIGRESDNTIQLPMGGVSRYHAKIERDAAGNWLIRDLGSTNGTLVDDVPVIGGSPLSVGSVITIGDQLLRVVDSGAAPSAPSAQPAAAPSAQQPAAAPSAPGAAPSQQPFFFRPQNTTSSVPLETAHMQEPQKPAQAGPAPVSPSEVPRGLFSKKTQDKPHATSGTKKLLSNVIFALIVILAACAGLWIFLKLNEAPQKPSAPTAVKIKVDNPFILYYEKESVERAKVFRFVLQIENGQMEVTLDEPQNKRRYYELFKDPIPDTLIAKLKQQILDTGFMDLQQEKIAGTSQDNRQHRRIMVGFDNKFCDVKVTNDVSETFNRVETIINETLLDEYDLGIISQNVDRILEDARTFLFVADEAFKRIDTEPSNLPKAITNYKLALRRYQLFDDPKPTEWKTARDGLAKAEAKLEEIRLEGQKNVRLFYELREYDKAVAECNRLLESFPPDSETYRRIRETKINIEKKLSLGNK